MSSSHGRSLVSPQGRTSTSTAPGIAAKVSAAPMNSLARQCFYGWCVDLAVRCVDRPFRYGLASGIRIRTAGPSFRSTRSPTAARHRQRRGRPSGPGIGAAVGAEHPAVAAPRTTGRVALDLDVVTFADRPPPKAGAGNELLTRLCGPKQPGLLSTKQPSCVRTSERFLW